MSILVKTLLSEELKFYLPKFKYIHQVSDFYINLKTKLVESFLTLQKIFTSTE